MKSPVRAAQSLVEKPQLTLPLFFGDHMVIQRGKPIPLFGKARPGAEIRVAWKKTITATKAARNGHWKIELPAAKAGGPYELSITDGTDSRILRDIHVGDVWFCSGQSNMEMAVSSCANAPSEIAAASHPLIRSFKTLRCASPVPVSEVEGQWTVCSPETVGAYTAAGYYFARDIQRETGIAIGLLHSSWGGTPIEAWMPREAFIQDKRYEEALNFQKTLEESPRQLAPEIKRRQREWKELYVSKDRGNKGYRLGLAKPEFDDSSWPVMAVPGAWEGHGLMIDGAVWLRRTVKIPAAWASKPLRLELGSLDDFDVTYYEGTEIGRTGKSVQDAYKTPRDYTIPAALVKEGPAVIATRIFDQFGSGGFTGAPEELRLSCPGESRSIALKGPWRYRIEWSVDRSVASPPMPELPEPRAQLSYLYNGMIQALTSLPIKGVLWYQGESNAGRATTYDHLFISLIRSWRKAWNQKDLPFYFVQLANFKSVPSVPGTDPWAELREAQTQALRLPHTGMAVAIDLGESTDIHPKNKQDVGRRLARLALARVYGRKVADSGPILKSCHITASGIRLTFSEVGQGLRLLDGTKLRGFAVAHRSQTWEWADARIEGRDTVLINNPFPQTKPAAVRYGWAANPDCNLCNSHGLPAAPFRTDRWPRVTEGHAWPF